MSHRFATFPSLKNKGVLITGGASGIGETIARAFADQGARVGILDINLQAGNRLIDELGKPHWFVECDVTNTESLQQAINAIAQHFGGLDVLIANAANDARHTAEDITPEGWERNLSLNLSHQFFAAQAIEPHLKASDGGSIICLSSIAWLNNTTDMVAYTTAKAGIHGMVRTLARTWGKHNIRVNALLPGWTMTEKQQELWIDDEAVKQIEASQCLPGRLMPDDIARMALFLASDDAAMITHQAFVVDGGWI